LARYFAKRAIKAQWQKEGLEPQYCDACDLTRAATAYLSEHPDLIQEAERALAECSHFAKLVTPAQRRKA
jgi:hypothetical protein